MAQPHGLAALLRRLKARAMHTVVYTGFHDRDTGKSDIVDGQ